MTEVCGQPIRIRNVRRSLIASTDNRVYLHRQNGLALPVRDVYDDFEAIKSRAAEWRRRQYRAVNRVMYSPAQPSPAGLLTGLHVPHWHRFTVI